MDIDLLSKMVKELILDNDEVALPGVGTFVAEMVPSSFSDRGYTIHPPYRRLYFRQRVDENDTALVDFYATSNSVDTTQAQRIVSDFLLEMRDLLKQKKTIVFPGLGRLRATRENNFFFVADEDLDIYPAGYGLEPISLKTHQETPEEVSSVVEQLRAILTEKKTAGPVVEPVLEDEEPAAEPAPQPESAPVAAPVVEPEPAPVAAPVAEPIVEQEPIAEPAVEPESVAEQEAVVEPENVVETAVEPETTVEPEPIVEPAVEPVAEPVVKKPAVEPAVQKPVVAPAVEKPVAPVAAPAKPATAISPEKPAKRPAWKIWMWIGISLVALVLLALIVFVILAHVAPDFIDSLLYTPEELEILHYSGEF